MSHLSSRPTVNSPQGLMSKTSIKPGRVFCRRVKVLHNPQMLTRPHNKWTPGLATALVILLTLGSITHWALRLVAERHLQMSATAPVADAAVQVDPANVALVLGAKVTEAVGKAAQASDANMASRFVLSGVLAGGKDGWAALISVDGQPAQPVRVGSAVADNLILQSVAGKTALLGAERTGSALVTLNLPEPKTGDNRLATDRGNAQPDSPEIHIRSRRNPEMGQKQIDE